MTKLCQGLRPDPRWCLPRRVCHFVRFFKNDLRERFKFLVELGSDVSKVNPQAVPGNLKQGMAVLPPRN